MAESPASANFSECDLWETVRFQPWLVEVFLFDLSVRVHLQILKRFCPVRHYLLERDDEARSCLGMGSAFQRPNVTSGRQPILTCQMKGTLAHGKYAADGSFATSVLEG